MKVANQEGTSTFDLEQAISYEVEQITESKRKKYSLPRGPMYAILLYYSITNPEYVKVVATYDRGAEAMQLYHAFLRALASGAEMFDFSGMVCEGNSEVQKEEVLEHE